jgi:D-sedoheptulose 7-phosphate isomerase
MSIFKSNLKSLGDLLENIRLLDDDVTIAGRLATDTLLAGGKIFFCGNGGSAADSQHLAAELVGRFVNDRPPLAAIALSTDSSVLTCVGNDYSFDEIFARQVTALGRNGDLLIGISTSGNSKNIIRAIEEAKKIGIKTLGLLGRDGGKIKMICDQSIIVSSDTTARIQECHILIGHTLCGIIEEGYFKK